MHAANVASNVALTSSANVASNVALTNVQCMQLELPPPLADATLVGAESKLPFKQHPSQQILGSEHTETNPDPAEPNAPPPCPLGGSMEPIWDKWCPSLSNCGTKGCQHQSNM